MHVHLRMQDDGFGHMPSWDPDVAEAVVDAIREACPGVIINLTTGIIGKDISGPVACLRRVKPEIAACNAGSLNYLKIKDNGEWAWPPMVFDNPVAKVQQFLDVMAETGTPPRVRVLRRRHRALRRHVPEGRAVHGRARVQLRHGRGPGMPCDADLLALLPRWLAPGAVWQSTLIGRQRDLAGAPAHGRTRRHAAQRAGRHLLPARRQRAAGNGVLIEALARCARHAGREIASPAEARRMLGLKAALTSGA